MGIVKSKFLVFIVISVIWTLVPQKLPTSTYDYTRWLYRVRDWENGGEIYERLFRVKSWKSKLPDIGDFFKWRFSKRHFRSSGKSYVRTFLMESCKAEFAHWMIILSSPVFLLLGGPKAFFEFFLLSTVLNLPYIIIQRYNRPRMIRLLDKEAQSAYELAPAKSA
jgi:glycosyl-4,4'-diaponeurosporenoate acyltransferase